MKKELTVTELARLGGRARAAKMTPEERSLIGRKGALARWGNPKGKQSGQKKQKHRGAILE